MADPKRIARGLYWDRSWRVVNGCTKISPGCDHCWSEAETNVRGSNPAVAHRYAKDEVLDGGKWNGQIKLASDNVLTEPMLTKKPQVWATWNDLFHEAVPHGHIVSVFSFIEAAPQHTFLVLTKRPDRMLYHFRGGLSKKFPVLPNLLLGTTIEGPESMWRRDALVMVPAALRFISFEPLLADPGEVDFSGIGWCIVGGESGHGARPMHPDWPRKLRDNCQAAGVPFFFKQWGEWKPWEPGDSGPVVHISARDGLWGHNPAFVNDPDIFKPVARADTRPICRVGKKAAGRLLYGRVWNEFPEVGK